MKKNSLGILTIICISATLLIVIFSLGAKISSNNPQTQFINKVKIIYNNVSNRNKKDIEKGIEASEYSSVIIFGEEEILHYVGKFNKETNKLNYLCVSDGHKLLEVENPDITLNYIEEYGATEFSNKECKIEG